MLKLQWGALTHLLYWLKLKRLTSPNVSEDVEQLELSYVGNGSVKWYNKLCKYSDSLLKLNTHLIFELAIPLFCVYQRWMKA